MLRCNSTACKMLLWKCCYSFEKPSDAVFFREQWRIHDGRRQGKPISKMRNSQFIQSIRSHDAMKLAIVQKAMWLFSVIQLIFEYNQIETWERIWELFSGHRTKEIFYSVHVIKIEIYFEILQNPFQITRFFCNKIFI